MIFGIGCDLVEIERIKLAYMKHERAFLEKLFSEEEIEYCLSHKNPYPSLAARFAAKEAAAKALGVGFGSSFGWKDCTIELDNKGKPTLILSEICLSRFGKLIPHLSLSHTNTHAMATVVLET